MKCRWTRWQVFEVQVKGGPYRFAFPTGLNQTHDRRKCLTLNILAPIEAFVQKKKNNITKGKIKDAV